MKELKYFINTMEFEFNFRDLSKNAKKTFKYIFDNIDRSFQISELMDGCKLSRQDYELAFFELEHFSIINFCVAESLESTDKLKLKSGVFM